MTMVSQFMRASPSCLRGAGSIGVVGKSVKGVDRSSPMRRVDAIVLGGLVGLAATAACGARTGLDSPAPVGIPPIEAGAGPGLSDCPDAGATLVYVVTGQGNLYSFYPPTAAFKSLG